MWIYITGLCSDPLINYNQTDICSILKIVYGGRVLCYFLREIEFYLVRFCLCGLGTALIG